MPLSAEEARIVRTWADHAPGKISLRLYRTQDARSASFGAFVDELRNLAPFIEVFSEDQPDPGPLGLAIRDNLLFQAVPSGHELQPFLELMRAGAERAMNAESTVKGFSLQWPATIRIYVAPHCPHCPRAVNLLAPLAFEDSRISVTVIDGTLFPELAERDGIRSAPTVLLDEAFRWTGIPPMEELRHALAERDPTQLSAVSLTRILKDGEAERLAAMILACGRAFPELGHVITHPEWSVRLGAAVVMEELAEQDRELAWRHLKPLWDRFSALERPIQGDVVYLMGLAAPREFLPRLEELIRAEVSEDMREVLKEAMEAILTRPEP